MRGCKIVDLEIGVDRSRRRAAANERVAAVGNPGNPERAVANAREIRDFLAVRALDDTQGRHFRVRQPRHGPRDGGAWLHDQTEMQRRCILGDVDHRVFHGTTRRAGPKTVAADGNVVEPEAAIGAGGHFPPATHEIDDPPEAERRVPRGSEAQSAGCGRAVRQHELASDRASAPQGDFGLVAIAGNDHYLRGVAGCLHPDRPLARADAKFELALTVGLGRDNANRRTILRDRSIDFDGSANDPRTRIGVNDSPRADGHGTAFVFPRAFHPRLVRHAAEGA